MPQKYKKDIINSLTDLFANVPNEQFTDFYGKSPKDILPDIFQTAREAKVEYKPLRFQDFGGYYPETNSIDITYKSLVDKYIDILSKSPLVELAPAEMKANLASALPHELGHAIYGQDLDKLDTEGHPTRTAWVDLHDKYFKNNKSLGNYQYKDDPSHSFADVFSIYASNPERLKNHFPEVYSFFKDLTGFEYKRPKNEVTK